MSVQSRVNPQIFKIHPYVAGKSIEEVAAKRRLKPGKILKLASNENVLGPSPKAIQAVQKAVHKLHLYPDGSGRALKEKIARELKVKPAQIILGNGSNEILEFVCRAFLSKGDEVVVPEHTFSMYAAFATIGGAKICKVPLKEASLDLDAIRQQVRAKTKVIFICNPNNPTGTVVSHIELKKMIQKIPPSVVIVIDEAYGDFRSGKGMKPSEEFLRRPNVVLLRTFSKIFGLASLRVGYGVAHLELADILNRVRQPFNVNGLAQAAALAGFADKAHQNKSKKMVAEGRSYLTWELRKIGLSPLPSEANFVCVRVGEAKEIAEEMEKEGVVIRPLGSFGLKEFIRITVGTLEQNKRVIETLKKALNKK